MGDDLPALSLTCPNHQALFSELTPRIANLLKQQGFDSKIVREIHRFVIGYKQSNASSSDVRVARSRHSKIYLVPADQFLRLAAADSWT